MKAVIDDKIPYSREAAARLFDETVYLPGSAIGPGDVKDADVLIVRTRTRCDYDLLAASRVRFVATATIGYDHLDTLFLEEAGIGWANCPGCYASWVGQYVENCLLYLRQAGLPLLQRQDLTVGIIGAGHVGLQVREHLQGRFRLLLNDPPRQRAEGRAGFADLDQVARECDIITFHTPLTHHGPDATYHLADSAFMGRLRRRPLIINAARGGVVDEAALLQALDDGRVGSAVIDTWEHEPHISRRLLDRALLATPHIAGYSADGKAHAAHMALEAVADYFGLTCSIHIEPPALPPDMEIPADEAERKLALYNPARDSAALKAAPEDFELLRGNYPLRRESFGPSALPFS